MIKSMFLIISLNQEKIFIKRINIYMPSYQINKGIGKPVEFQGLKAQYIFYLIGGMIGIFLFFIFLKLIGANGIFSIIFVFLLGGGLIYCVFYLNKKYGQYGLMKLLARNGRPKYLINFGYKKVGFFYDAQQKEKAQQKK